MGGYVLYVMAQSVGCLMFAYMASTVAVKERRLRSALVAAGLYLVLAATVLEVWADRHGWERGTLGAFVGLLVGGVLVVGAGSLRREADDLEDARLVNWAVYAALGCAVAVALAFILGSGGSDALVESSELLEAELAGGFSHLGPAGVALGALLYIGAALVIASGARSVFVRGDGRGIWLWVAGVMYALWPLDISAGPIPLGPSLVLFAGAMVFFGFQEPSGKEPEGPGDEGDVKGKDPGQTGLQDWLREASEARGTPTEEEEGGGDEPPADEGAENR